MFMNRGRRVRQSCQPAIETPEMNETDQDRFNKLQIIEIAQELYLL